MKLHEIFTEQELTVVKSDLKQTTLVDPKTKITTIVPKDPNKPGMIQKDPSDPTGKKFLLDPKVNGEVDKSLTPGQKVMVKANL